METLNKKFILLTLISICSLLLGTLLYTMLRENTYISIFIRSIIHIDTTAISAGFLNNAFLKYYFPDFLWSLSLAAILHVVIVPSNYGSIICSTLSTLTGICFELFQHIGFISGTGDFLDIFSYALAGLLISILYLYKKGAKNK